MKRPLSTPLALPILALSLTVAPAIAQKAEKVEKELDPYEWTIASYRFPADDLVHGFASEERGALIAPPMPKADADDATWEKFIRKSSSITIHYLDQMGIAFPEGALLIFDPESMTLAARLPRISQSSVDFTSRSLVDRAPRYLAFDHVIFEAPADRVRELLGQTNGQADHSEMLSTLEKMADRGNATRLNSGKIETRSGQRTIVAAGAEHAQPVDVVLGAGDSIAYQTEITDLGTTLELDPVIGSDGTSMDLTYALEHHYAPPVIEDAALTQIGGQQVTALAVHHHNAEITSAITAKRGDTKLLGVWHPTGVVEAEQKDVLQLSFLSGDMVEVLPLQNEALKGILKKRGESVLPTPKGLPAFAKGAEEIPEGMIVRRFTIPPDFLQQAGSGGGETVADPFAVDVASEPRFTIQATAKDILQARGVLFPQGASANYLAHNSILVVRNTPENIASIEAYVGDLLINVRRTIAITTHVVEAPATLLREISGKARSLPNHVRLWQELQDRESLRILNTHWIETRSGQRCSVDVGRLHNHPVAAEINASGLSLTAAESGGKEEKPKDAQPVARGFKIGGDNDSLSANMETMRVGTELKLDPVIGNDGETVDLNISLLYDYAEPIVRVVPPADAETLRLDGPSTSFQRAHVTTAATMRSGAMRMLGMWQPSGSTELEEAGVLQAVFVQVEVIPVDG